MLSPSQWQTEKRQLGRRHSERDLRANPEHDVRGRVGSGRRQEQRLSGVGLPEVRGRGLRIRRNGRQDEVEAGAVTGGTIRPNGPVEHPRYQETLTALAASSAMTPPKPGSRCSRSR